MPHDVNAALPKQVVVTFPARGSITPYTVTVSLASLNLPEFRGATGFDGTKVFHDTAEADGVSSPSNGTELANLAKQIATDYYRQMAAKVEWSYNGIQLWTPEALSDQYEWSVTADGVITRVERDGWLTHLDELHHYGTVGASDEVTVFPGPVEFGNAVFYDSVTVTPSSNQNNYFAGDQTLWYISATSAINITGMAYGYCGQIRYITNSGSYPITFTNEDTNSTDVNRFHNGNCANYVLYPDQTVAYIYDCTLHRWRPTSSGTPDISYFRQAGTNPFDQWYTATSFTNSLGVTFFNTQKLFAIPYISPRGGTLDKMGIALGVVGPAGSKCRIGIYDSTSQTNLYPNNLIVDSGDIAMDAGAATAKTVNINVSLAPGVLYWLVAITNSNMTSGTLGSIVTTAMWGLLGYANTLQNQAGVGLSISQTYGALPTPFPAGANIQTTQAGVFLPAPCLHYTC